MDERWARALRAKGIEPDRRRASGKERGKTGQPGGDISDGRAADEGARQHGRRIGTDAHGGSGGRYAGSVTSGAASAAHRAARAMPFKATGHKGGISRQGG